MPPDFLHTVVPKYPALQQRVQAADYFSRVNPFSPQISLEHLDIPDSELLPQIGIDADWSGHVTFGTRFGSTE